MAALLISIIAAGVAIAAVSHPAWVLVTYFGLYLLSGLIESGFMLRRYFAEKKASASLADVIDEDEEEGESGEAPVDQEVL
jgi:hypothetical protein